MSRYHCSFYLIPLLLLFSGCKTKDSGHQPVGVSFQIDRGKQQSLAFNGEGTATLRSKGWTCDIKSHIVRGATATCQLKMGQKLVHSQMLLNCADYGYELLQSSGHSIKFALVCKVSTTCIDRGNPTKTVTCPLAPKK